MGGDTTKKTTIMVLTVDLQCCSCYKKVKKILCKFPQIRDQVYDEKANKVTITVVCCDPEKIRDKLCCKGCGVIKSIEIKEPPKPKDPEKTKQPEKTLPEKTKQPEKTLPEKTKEPEKKEPEKSKETPKLNPVAPPQGYCCGQCSEGHTGGPCYHWYGRPIPPAPGYCCGQCSEGHTGGPCYEWYGRPVPPAPCYDTYGYRPVTYGYGRGCYVSKCDQYFSDENATGCSIM